AAGIGGGSADAAATLRALVRLWNLDVAPAELAGLAFALGADVPACLAARPVYVGGAGERVLAGPTLPPTAICLVNPRVETPTGPIFRAFDAGNPHPPSPAFPRPTGFANLTDLALFLSGTRNDLEAFAVRHNSVIGVARDFVADCSGALVARMSGSGATVFGVFSSGVAAKRAERAAAAKGWWALATSLSSAR
ncbi:MAG: hypothetical protein K2Q06_04760, partial [Parvularculaceae bacterium]|nr:hypothetical protein [Parvularculaceae bacterium]